MLYFDLEQHTQDWFNMRLGACTGSRVKDAVSKMKNGKDYYAAREDYLADCIVERLSGVPIDHYVSPAMQWGIENEVVGVAAYEDAMDWSVTPCGLATHPQIEWFMASPDGLVGDDGCIEVKCPTSATHIQWIIDGCVPDEHLAQMKAVMSCAERKWCDFCSFDPRMPKEYRLFVRRLEFDQKLNAEMEEEVQKFLAEVKDRMEMLKKKLPAMCMTTLRAK